MADSIKIGTQNVTFKVGSTSVSAICLGNTCVYRDTPTPTSYTYSVTITGLENGDTTNIEWSSYCGDWYNDYNVGNGTYTYTTSCDRLAVSLDTSGLSDYTVDYSQFELYSGGSQTVTFTYQGGGGLVHILVGTDMSQYVGQSISRIVVNDTTTSTQTIIFFNSWADAIFITNWNVSGQGQFSSLNTQLPIDISIPTPAVLADWTSASAHNNIFNDLQIEWA